MSTGLNDIINLTITRETQAVEQASFSVPIIMGVNSTLTERYKLYSTDDLASFAAELTGTTNAPEYKAATTLATQSPRVPTFAVGRRDSADSSYTDTFTAIVAESNNFYGVVLADSGMDTARIVFDADFVASNTIDGEVNGVAWAQVAYATSHSNTASLLATAIQALSSVSTAVVDPLDVTDRTILITMANSATCRPSDVVVALGASQATASYTGPIEDRKDISTWVEANKKYFATQSGELEIKDSTEAADTTSLAYVFSAAGRERTSLIYHDVANHLEFPGAAFVGRQLPYVNDNTAGKYSTAYKDLKNITVGEYEVSERTNITDKSCNYFESRGGARVTVSGFNCNSELASIVMFADWLEAKICELVWAHLVNSPNVPYTDPGINSIKAKIEKALSLGQNNGGISPEDYDSDGNQKGGFIVTVPKSADVPANDKANYILNNVAFTGWLSGSILKVTISGILTY